MWVRWKTSPHLPWQYILHGDILDAKESTGVSIIKVDKASSPWVTFGTTYYKEGISLQWSSGDIHEAWHLPRNLKLQNMNNVSWWLRIIFLDHPRKHRIRSKKKLVAPAKVSSFQYWGPTRKFSEHAPTKRLRAWKIPPKHVIDRPKSFKNQPWGPTWAVSKRKLSKEPLRKRKFWPSTPMRRRKRDPKGAPNSSKIASKFRHVVHTVFWCIFN